MSWTETLFRVKKPIVGMLHLRALPGDPAYKETDTMKNVVQQARADLLALQAGGVDGILISNEFSLPYQRTVDMVTPCAMARVIGELKTLIRVPFGVDCISDGRATLELAAAVEADFVRGTFSGVYVGDGGFYNNDISETLRRKKALGLEKLRMLYFLNPESDMNLDVREVPKVAQSLIFKAKPDGFCVSASAAGQAVEGVLLTEVKVVCQGVPIFVNTGCRKENISEKLEAADAACVGTTFKRDGDFYAEVDQARVKDFMTEVKAYRKTLEEVRSNG